MYQSQGSRLYISFKESGVKSVKFLCQSQNDEKHNCIYLKGRKEEKGRILFEIDESNGYITFKAVLSSSKSWYLCLDSDGFTLKTSKSASLFKIKPNIGKLKGTNIVYSSDMCDKNIKRYLKNRDICDLYLMFDPNIQVCKKKVNFVDNHGNMNLNLDQPFIGSQSDIHVQGQTQPQPIFLNGQNHLQGHIQGNIQGVNVNGNTFAQGNIHGNVAGQVNGQNVFAAGNVSGEFVQGGGCGNTVQPIAFTPLAFNNKAASRSRDMEECNRKNAVWKIDSEGNGYCEPCTIGLQYPDRVNGECRPCGKNANCGDHNGFCKGTHNEASGVDCLYDSASETFKVNCTADKCGGTCQGKCGGKVFGMACVKDSATGAYKCKLKDWWKLILWIIGLIIFIIIVAFIIKKVMKKPALSQSVAGNLNENTNTIAMVDLGKAHGMNPSGFTSNVPNVGGFGSNGFIPSGSPPINANLI